MTFGQRHPEQVDPITPGWSVKMSYRADWLKRWSTVGKIIDRKEPSGTAPRLGTGGTPANWQLDSIDSFPWHQLWCIFKKSLKAISRLSNYLIAHTPTGSQSAGPCLSVPFFSLLSLKKLQFPNQAPFPLRRDALLPLHFITESLGSVKEVHNHSEACSTHSSHSHDFI